MVSAELLLLLVNAGGAPFLPGGVQAAKECVPCHPVVLADGKAVACGVVRPCVHSAVALALQDGGDAAAAAEVLQDVLLADRLVSAE